MSGHDPREEVGTRANTRAVFVSVWPGENGFSGFASEEVLAVAGSDRGQTPNPRGLTPV